MRLGAVVAACLLCAPQAALAADPGADRYRLRETIGDELRLSRFHRFMAPEGLIVGGDVQPNWMSDGVSFWYADGAPDNTVIVRVDGSTGRSAPLLDVPRTRAALAELLGREPPYKGLPFESIGELGNARYRFSFEGSEYILSTRDYSIEPAQVSSHAARAIPRTYQRTVWLVGPMPVTEAPSPDRRWFAGLKDGNIVLRAPVDDRTVMLTTDGTQEVGWDIEAPRIKLKAGMRFDQELVNPWSPDGNRLFATKMDRRAVREMTYIHYLKREEEVSAHKYQRAGGPLDIAHPHVIDVLAKRALPFQLGNTEDQYFT